MAEFVSRMKSWVEGFSKDVAAVKALCDDDTAPEASREYAAAALSYLLTRMDIVPDWEETTGILDDAMVMRVAVALASDIGFGDSSGETMQTLARLANEAEVVSGFLGPEYYPRLRKLTKEYVHNEVRGRRASTIVHDKDIRQEFFDEVDRDLRRHPPAPMTDPKGIKRKLMNYFELKLKETA